MYFLVIIIIKQMEQSRMLIQSIKPNDGSLWDPNWIEFEIVR